MYVVGAQWRVTTRQPAALNRQACSNFIPVPDARVCVQALSDGFVCDVPRPIPLEQTRDLENSLRRPARSLDQEPTVSAVEQISRLDYPAQTGRIEKRNAGKVEDNQLDALGSQLRNALDDDRPDVHVQLTPRDQPHGVRADAGCFPGHFKVRIHVDSLSVEP